MNAPAESINRRMAKGAGWSVTSRLIVRSLGFISTLILARLLIPEDFGLVVVATTCVGIIEVMGEFGLDTVLITRQDATKSLYDTAWTLQVLRGAVLFLLVFFGSEYLASLFDDVRLVAVLNWLALGALVQGFVNIGIVEFRKELLLHKELVFQVIQKLASFFITLILAYYWRNYWALVAGILTGHVIGLLLSYRMVIYRPSFDLSEWNSIFHFSKWLVMINVLNYVSNRSDNLILGGTVGAKWVGLYGVANEVASLPTTELIYPIQRALFPGFSKIASDLDQLRSTYLATFQLVVMLAAPLGVGIALVADPMVKVVLGEKWLLTIPLLEILAVSGAFRVMGASAGSVMYALARVKTVTVISIINTVARVILLFWWTHVYGAEGAAWAILVTTLFSLTLNLGVLSKMLDLPLLFAIGSLWRTLISLLVMVFVVLAIDHVLYFTESYGDLVIQLTLKIMLGAIAYIAAHFLFWILAGRPNSAEKRVLELFFRVKKGASIR